jgi:hypothetical protein
MVDREQREGAIGVCWHKMRSVGSRYTRSPSRQERLAEFGLKPLKAAGVGGGEGRLHAGDFNWGGIIR